MAKTGMNLVLVERYAKALFAVSEKRKVTGKVHSELTTLVRHLSTSEALRNCLSHPFINKEDKIQAITGLAGQHCAEPLQEFLKQLFKHKRLNLLPKIMLAFETLVDQSKDLIHTTVRSAGALNELQRERLQKTLETTLGKKVICDWREDRELLGGIQLKIGDTLWDGTLKGRLAALNNYFTQEA